MTKIESAVYLVLCHIEQRRNELDKKKRGEFDRLLREELKIKKMR